jgi:predicted nucleic acid-binding protein
MKKTPKIYVDTSVIGGCVDKEFQVWSRKLMSEFRMGVLQPVVSALTHEEISRSPVEVRNIYAELLDSGAEFVDVSAEAIKLADNYLAHKILAPNYRNDAIHIAVATINKVDMLVSWNFQHIVHYDKIKLFNAVNLESGYKPIEIYSPREVVDYGN